MRVMVSFIAAALMTAALAGAAAAAPKLALSTDVWDFGEIYQWTNPSFTVGITNPGDRPLEITDVKASCGCTATFLSSKVIKPGEDGFLKIDFASYTVTGRIGKLVRLSTNDPAAPQKDISIRGFVRDDKAAVGGLDKYYVDLGVVAPFETRRIDVIISNDGNIDLDIKDIELPDGWFLDSAFPKKAKVRNGVAVSFGYRPPIDKGPIDDRVRITTSGIDGGLLELRVAGYVADVSRVTDEIVITPSAFTAGGPDPQPMVLSVKNEGGAPVTIEGVDSSLVLRGDEFGSTEVAPGEVGTVRLDVDPAGLAPGARGYVYIRLALPIEVK